MKKCDLLTPASRLRHALKHLEEVWQRSGDEWDDAVSRRFGEHQLAPMLPKLKVALDAVGRMHQLMSEVQRDCEQ